MKTILKTFLMLCLGTAAQASDTSSFKGLQSVLADLRGAPAESTTTTKSDAPGKGKKSGNFFKDSKDEAREKILNWVIPLKSYLYSSSPRESQIALELKNKILNYIINNAQLSGPFGLVKDSYFTFPPGEIIVRALLGDWVYICNFLEACAKYQVAFDSEGKAYTRLSPDRVTGKYKRVFHSPENNVFSFIQNSFYTVGQFYMAIDPANIEALKRAGYQI